MKPKPSNPFKWGTDIPDEYFCDRKTETKAIIKLIDNGSNIVLKAPRRIGKSSLIKHILKQQEIKDKYNTFYVDLYGTKDMQGLVRLFQKAFMESPLSSTEKGRKSINELFQRLMFGANINEQGIISGFGISILPRQEPVYSFEEICKYLEHTQKPNIVIFDEFQAIQDYKERAAAIIRSQVQQMNNTRFIFAGSERHMLINMFENPNEPFYRSSRSMDLGLIPKETYVTFCNDMFGSYNKRIRHDSIGMIYDIFSGNTYDMQEIMKTVFPEIPVNETATEKDMTDAIDLLLDSRDTEFRGILDTIDSPRTQRLLICIAFEGRASGLTSMEKIKRYGLDSASSVQNSLAVLERKGVIRQIGKGSFEIQNRFFELWLAREAGELENKFNNASERFKKELEAAKPKLNISFPKGVAE